jgi:hypothetical protein
VSTYYRVEPSDTGGSACEHCGRGGYWTIIYGPDGDETEIGTAWEDRGLADDICDLMNMAFDAGMETALADPVPPEAACEAAE